MKTYFLLHLEHENDIKVIVELCTELRAIGIIEHRFSWNKCFIIYQTNAEKMMQHLAILHR